MNDILKKLHYKGQQKALVLNAPAIFNQVLEELILLAPTVDLRNDYDEVEFAIVFASKQHELNHFIEAIAPKLIGDATLWVCYPKGTSKKYSCDFNRDTGWAILKSYDLTSVSQVAIDQDWSALRFRKTLFIKQLTRKFTTR